MKTISTNNQNIIVFFGIYVVIFLFAWMTPFGMDDFNYVIQQDSIKDIFEKEFHQYMTWSGRSVAHVWGRFLLLLPRVVIAILTAGLFTGTVTYILMIIYGAGWRDKINPYQILIVCFSLWFLSPKFGSVFFYIIGSANYGWMLLLALAFLFPYRCLIDNQFSPLHISIKTILMCVGGLLAGWTNENTGFMVIIFSMLVIGYVKCQKRSVPAWAWLGLLFACVGFVFLVVAPGNYVRMAHPAFADWANAPVFHKLYLFFTVTITKNNMAIGAFVLTLGVILLWIIRKDLLDLQKPYVRNFLLFLIVTDIGALVLAVAPYAPSRVWLSVFVFLLIAVLSTVFVKVRPKYLNKIALLFTCVGIISMGIHFVQFVENYHIQKERWRLIEAANGGDVVIPRFIYSNKYFFIENDSIDITDDPQNPLNQYASEYYQVRSIRVEANKKP